MSDFEDFLDDVFDPDYLYVEESHDVVDDLAERAVASPIPLENDDDLLDYDQFDYWEDIEYNDDGFNDAEPRRSRKRAEPDTEKAGLKRKKAFASSSPQKRLKAASGEACPASGAESPTPTVVWRTHREEKGPPTIENFDRSFALLKDWRERYADSSGFKTAKSPNSTPRENVALSEPFSPPSDSEDEVVRMDVDVLKAALRNNLARLGAAPEDIDETTLLEFAARLMQNQDAADDIIGELADNILGAGEDDDSEDAVVPDWLTQQLKSNNAEHEATDHQGTSQKEHSLPTPSSSQSTRSTVSTTSTDAAPPALGKDVPSLPTEETLPAPRDEPEAAHTLESFELDRVEAPQDTLVDAQAKKASPRKRKADGADGADEKATHVPEPKRRAPSYAAPTATSKAKASIAAPKASQGRKAKRG
ncbi:hypothetical protein H2201_008244 [Coniosporium apollinis]|uniref:HBS1-like protein N-terminal domain-containing protein n=2 Tax=Coniosporium TaxID=2810619 RepID=A0ABQ9NK16_9PEZI|nr:hypothetical protein H2199_003039 [Cladosporium sp. JES 115]KAJ9657263.1 hypothetical protein H2201_008244 [Coniosporium apollinis]